MGAKTWMVVASDQPAKDVFRSKPQLNAERSEQLAHLLFPHDRLQRLEDVSLAYACPPDNELVIGCFGSVTVVAAKEFGIDYLSKIPTHFHSVLNSPYVYAHAMHSVVDWFAYAVWRNSELVRALSLSPDSGLLEDIGEKLDFEVPYWEGQHPATDPEDPEDTYPFVFHPLDLGEAALDNLFGYVLEGFTKPEQIEPEEFPLLAFKRSRNSWWKFW